MMTSEEMFVRYIRVRFGVDIEPGTDQFERFWKAWKIDVARSAVEKLEGNYARK